MGIVHQAAAAAAVRILIIVTGLGDVFSSRMEVSTPLNSHKQLRECFQLWRWGMPPYSGSSCHTAPLIAWLTSWSEDYSFAYRALNVLLDITAAFIVMSSAEGILARSASYKKGTVAQRRIGCGCCLPSSSPGPSRPLCFGSCTSHRRTHGSLHVLLPRWRCSCGRAPQLHVGLFHARAKRPPPVGPPSLTPFNRCQAFAAHLQINQVPQSDASVMIAAYFQRSTSVRCCCVFRHRAAGAARHVRLPVEPPRHHLQHGRSPVDIRKLLHSLRHIRRDAEKRRAVQLSTGVGLPAELSYAALSGKCCRLERYGLQDTCLFILAPSLER